MPVGSISSETACGELLLGGILGFGRQRRVVPCEKLRNLPQGSASQIRVEEVKGFGPAEPVSAVEFIEPEAFRYLRRCIDAL